MRDVIAPDIEDRYGLTPLQQGMLFHSLYSGEPDAYWTQAHWRITGDLAIDAYAAAWQQVVDRHPILRTSFHWERGEEPVQVVHRQAQLPVSCHDWRTLSTEDQTRQIDELLKNGRARGFDPSHAPLMRITTAQLGDAAYHVVWTAHHLIIDGRSLAIVFREVLALYGAAVSGKPAALPPPAPFREFVREIGRQDMTRGRQFWRDHLEGLRVTPMFPGLAPRPGQQSTTQEREIPIPEGIERALRRLAHDTDSTLNTVLMAAWAIALGHATGADDATFGLIVGAGNGIPRTLVGLTIATAPLRVRVSPELELSSLIRRMHSIVPEIRRHAHVPLAEIRHWSELESGTPLFESILSFDNSAIDRLAGQVAGLQISRPAIIQDSNYPLNLVVRRVPALTLCLIAHCPPFEERYVQLLPERLENLLTAIAHDSTAHVGDLPSMPPSEARLIASWTGVAAPFPRDRRLHELVEEQAERTPDAPAVGAMTYRQLNRRANALAHRLRARGAGPGVVAGLATERGADLVVGMLGIAKSGAAALPIDSSHPPDRISFMLRDTGARLVVTDGKSRHVFPAGIPLVDIADSRQGAPDDDNVRSPGGADSLAYVVYTSGTGGLPKGVMVEHRGVVNLVTWHNRAFSVSPSDRASQIASPAFDATAWEIWPYLVAGASIHFVPADVRTDPRRLQAWLLDQSISIAFLPTPLAEGVLTLPWPATSVLRIMLTGGDALRVAPSSALPFTLVNNYGPSECTVVATSGRIDPAGEITIGRPIDNAEIHLLDADKHPVPIGVTGEIYVGGEGVARGYVNQPALTQERFSPHPSRHGEHLYRTGDLGRRLPDGRLVFVGRVDDQVQICGVRVEPGEVAAAIRRHPDICGAVVVADPVPRKQRLVAYVVPREGKTLDTASLQNFASHALPRSMLPSAYVPLPALPLTPNGKVDREALPSLAPTTALSCPRGEVEEILAAIWSEMLGIDGIGRGDDFFALGGDSLLAVELLERISIHLGPELEVGDIVDAPTLGALAARLESGSAHGQSPLVPIRPLGALPPFFFAAPVLGTVFPYYDLAHHLDPGQPFYGLQPSTWLEDGEGTVESLAEQYLHAIRRVQRDGPYYLGGWSFGGLVAFEMARRLRLDGEDIGALVVLDTPAPSTRLKPVRIAHFLLGTALRGLVPYARDYRYLLHGTSIRRQPTSASNVETLGFISGTATISAIVPPQSRLLLHHPPTIRRMLRAFRAGLFAGLRYRPEPYHGSMTLLRVAGHSDAALGWECLARRVEVLPISGDHMSVLRRPHVTVLARVIQDVLKEHQAERQPGEILLAI